MNSKPTVKSAYGHISKICGQCGKQESNRWLQHWKKWHGIDEKEDRKVLRDDQEPL